MNAPVHETQAIPPVPHCAFVLPGMHALLAQQPFGQFAGPHVATHVRVTPLHDGVGLPGGCVQSVHSPPPGGPHALSWMPSVQVLPEQHPVVQVTEQAAGWQTPP